MSQQPRTKRSRTRDPNADPAQTVTVTTGPIGDDHGYLAISLAAGALAIVGVLVIMIVLAAT